MGHAAQVALGEGRARIVRAGLRTPRQIALDVVDELHERRTEHPRELVACNIVDGAVRLSRPA